MMAIIYTNGSTQAPLFIVTRKMILNCNVVRKNSYDIDTVHQCFSEGSYLAMRKDLASIDGSNFSASGRTVRRSC